MVDRGGPGALPIRACESNRGSVPHTAVGCIYVEKWSAQRKHFPYLRRFARRYLGRNDRPKYFSALGTQFREMDCLSGNWRDAISFARGPVRSHLGRTILSRAGADPAWGS